MHAPGIHYFPLTLPFLLILAVVWGDGAGTFDGIFVTGLVAVVLASLATAPRDATPGPQ